MLRRFVSKWIRELVAFALGLAINCAFAFDILFPVAIVLLAPLFYYWSEGSARKCASIGFAFGFGLFVLGISWMFGSVRNFGNATVLLAASSVVAVSVLCALFTAGCGYLQAKFRTTTPVRYLIIIPTLWVISEWGRSWVLGGFPWLYVGYTQIDSWLSGWAPYLGIYGVSFVVCVSSGCLVLLASQEKNRIRLSLAVFAMCWCLGWLGAQVNWVRVSDTPLEASLIQGEVSIHDKWNLKLLDGHLANYLQLIEQKRNSDVVILPEAAVAYTAHELAVLGVWEMLSKHPADILVGVFEEVQDGDNVTIYNSVFGLSDRLQFYRKQRLVPFGEYVPMREQLAWLSNIVKVPKNNLSAYRRPQGLITLAGFQAAISICFEDAFPDLLVDSLKDATFIVNVSEDGWFRRGLIQRQRLQMSRMRSTEAARPMLKVANFGTLAAIDHEGDLISRSDRKSLDVKIYPTYGTTPFVYFGGSRIMILLTCALLLGANFFPVRERSNENQGSKA